VGARRDLLFEEPTEARAVEALSDEIVVEELFADEAVAEPGGRCGR
jgi:hypothetical protein